MNAKQMQILMAQRAAESAQHEAAFLRAVLDEATRAWIAAGIRGIVVDDNTDPDKDVELEETDLQVLFGRVNLIRERTALPYLTRADYGLRRTQR